MQIKDVFQQILMACFDGSCHSFLEAQHPPSQVHVYKPLGDRDPLLMAYFIMAPSLQMRRSKEQVTFAFRVLWALGT